MAREGLRGQLPDYSIRPEGVLRFQNQIVISKDEGLKWEILEETH